MVCKGNWGVERRILPDGSTRGRGRGRWRGTRRAAAAGAGAARARSAARRCSHLENLAAAAGRGFARVFRPPETAARERRVVSGG
jgi:hypothetical protein